MLVEWAWRGVPMDSEWVGRIVRQGKDSPEGEIWFGGCQHTPVEVGLARVLSEECDVCEACACYAAARWKLDGVPFLGVQCRWWKGNVESEEPWECCEWWEERASRVATDAIS